MLEHQGLEASLLIFDRVNHRSERRGVLLLQKILRKQALAVNKLILFLTHVQRVLLHLELELLPDQSTFLIMEVLRSVLALLIQVREVRQAESEWREFMAD